MLYRSTLYFFPYFTFIIYKVRVASENAARCVGNHSTLRWQMQHVALANAARCVGECSTLRWRMQHAVFVFPLQNSRFLSLFWQLFAHSIIIY